MRVRLLTELSLNGAKAIGAVVDVLDAQGQALVDHGLAEVVESGEVEAPDAATLADAPERATMPRARKRSE